MKLTPGCCRNSSRDFRQSPRISHSSSLTDWADSMKKIPIRNYFKPKETSYVKLEACGESLWFLCDWKLL